MGEINISDKEVVEILEEQRRYELAEFKRLKTARTEWTYIFYKTEKKKNRSTK